MHEPTVSAPPARDPTIETPAKPGNASTAPPARFVVALLCLGTLLVFAPLRQAEFVSYDDGVYVTHNPMTRQGITGPGMVWAWTYTGFNWHPLTWLSHMLDCQLFGLNAGAHHLTSLLLHVANTALLLYVLRRLTRAFWPSVFVAALFAVHPLHVEPVAWISARKDLLSTWWWFTALLAYVRYTERRSPGRYGLVCLCLALSLLCKGMAITLPVLLLLLDYWPLQRWPGTADTGTGRARRWDLLREKLPLLLIAIGGMVVQVIAQRQAEAWRSLAEVPIALRLANALVSYAKYVGMMLWPTSLAIPYPLHPHLPPRWQIAGALLWLILTSAVVARFGRQHRYLVTGWLWYLITLLPVIGLMSIGVQSMADRYTYVSLVGLFVVIAWGMVDLAQLRPQLRLALPVAAGIVILACAGLTRHQIRYWHDSVALFEHTTAVTDENVFAATNLAAALKAAGHPEAARQRYREALGFCANALRIAPANAALHNNLATLLMEDGQRAAAREHWQEALRLDPTFAGARLNFAMALLDEGRVAEAIAEYEQAVQIDPRRAGVHSGFAQALQAAGRPADAIAQYREELRWHPNDGDSENNLGAVLKETGAREEARAHFTAALRLNPFAAEVHNNLGVLLFEDGRFTEAEAHFREALRLQPGYAAALVDLGMVRLQTGDAAGAREHFQAALALDPANPAAQSGAAQAQRALSAGQ